ncbi:hypothetical protein FNAPI_527 [Fusarium napiforme]|uniref:Uncharacterized protein n=1 Tax=Fusarium napiforme TaxID=42672 RepID=A0A8H5K9X9_9HYPO|nr:hypothetical protein FNAPI_527 [Fusarium napiforme]
MVTDDDEQVHEDPTMTRDLGEQTLPEDHALKSNKASALKGGIDLLKQKSLVTWAIAKASKIGESGSSLPNWD